MGKRLDDLSRNLASGMSRRQALQIFAAGALAAVFGRSALSVDAEGQGKIISNFCKDYCTRYFTGRGTRGGDFTGNYENDFSGYYANEVGFAKGINYYANYTSLYDSCMTACQPCPSELDRCSSGQICVQAESYDPYRREPLEIYCIQSA